MLVLSFFFVILILFLNKLHQNKFTNEAQKLITQTHTKSKEKK